MSSLPVHGFVRSHFSALAFIADASMVSFIAEPLLGKIVTDEINVYAEKFLLIANPDPGANATKVC
jgi:hypothetical protein